MAKTWQASVDGWAWGMGGTGRNGTGQNGRGRDVSGWRMSARWKERSTEGEKSGGTAQSVRWMMGPDGG
jgi:hypothetical protein